jgi:hypothetical protein
MANNPNHLSSTQRKYLQRKGQEATERQHKASMQEQLRREKTLEEQRQEKQRQRILQKMEGHKQAQKNVTVRLPKESRIM